MTILILIAATIAVLPLAGKLIYKQINNNFMVFAENWDLNG